MDASSRPGRAADADAARDLYGLVRSAVRFLVSIRVAECALIGVSVAGLTIAAGILSGDSSSSPALRAAGALGAVFAASGWWLERRPDIASVVRRIDRREGWSGELVTAFEVGRGVAAGRSASEIGELLGRRVAAQVSLARCLRAAAPSSAALLALPFASAAVLFLAIEATRAADTTDEGRVDARALAAAGVEAVADSLSSAAQHLRQASSRAVAAGPVASEEAREMLALATAAEDVRRELASGRLPARVMRDLDDQAARLQALASAARTDRALATDLDQAERALNAARRDLAQARGADPLRLPQAGGDGPASDVPGDSAWSSTSGQRPPASAGVSQTPSTPARDPGSSTGRPGAGSPGGGGDRAPTGVPAPDTAGDALLTEERGTTGGRWWAQRYDAVVERWVEAQREERTGEPRDR